MIMEVFKASLAMIWQRLKGPEHLSAASQSGNSDWLTWMPVIALARLRMSSVKHLQLRLKKNMMIQV
jgi:hypothetical protein